MRLRAGLREINNRRGDLRRLRPVSTVPLLRRLRGRLHPAAVLVRVERVGREAAAAARAPPPAQLPERHCVRAAGNGRGGELLRLAAEALVRPRPALARRALPLVLPTSARVPPVRRALRLLRPAARGRVT